MLMPSGFDQANRKDRLNRRLQKANQLNDRLRNFFNEVKNDVGLNEKQKRRIVKETLKNFEV